MATAQSVTQAVASAITTQDGSAFALALPLEENADPALIAQLTAGDARLEMICGTALDEPYDEMLLECFQSAGATSKGEHVEAYANMERAVSAFQSAFEKDTSWSLPALHTLDLALRRTAQRADLQHKEKGEKPCRLQEAAGLLQKSFRVVVTDRAPLETRRISRVWGTCPCDRSPPGPSGAPGHPEGEPEQAAGPGRWTPPPPGSPARATVCVLLSRAAQARRGAPSPPASRRSRPWR